MDKDKLNKRYKALRWAQHISFWLGIASCVLPMLIASIRVIPSIKDTESRLAFGGVAIFFTAIVGLVLAKNVVKRFSANLPITLTVFIFVAALTVFMMCLQKVIDDAVAILTVGLIGCFVGVIFEFASIVCKYNADEIEHYYKKGKYENGNV